MGCKIEFLDYSDTGYFSSLVLDYLQEDSKLKPFYTYSPRHPDVEKIIAARKAFPTDRGLLVEELNKTYTGIHMDKAVKQNLRLLAEENTFTVCTAHQPNLFTGYLYFIYKIVHAIKLAVYLKAQYPQYNFVPVYYMGSEDNDLEELGTIHLYGKTYRWQTDQSGAVGRMRPENLESLIDEITKELGNNEHIRDIKTLLQEAYLGHENIQTATLYLVNALFGRFGLVVLIADSPGFKKAFFPVMREELFEQSSSPIVKDTIEALSKDYHAQAAPRDINLFYLADQLRERIVKEDEQWKVLNTDKTFNRQEIEQELQKHPERFSPNVILRGVLQETILPNLIFIGGGGELSYWMELKRLFSHFEVPFPLLLLRNSVLWVDEKSVKRLQKVGLQPADLFRDTEALISEFVKKNTHEELVLKEEYREIERLFAALAHKAANIDVTLKASVDAELTRTLRSIGKLEHKFLKAEKNKFGWQTELIRSVKSRLFPQNTLQERVENILPYYALYGPGFIDALYEHLDPLNRKFIIVQEAKSGVKKETPAS